MKDSLMEPILPSELIITEKGTIYHLDLAPEHLAGIVLTVGDPGRVPEVSKYFDRITHKAAHREFITHAGYIGKKNIMVISSGIGPDNIDIVLNELDALANIDFKTRTIKEQKTSFSLMRLGTCGCLQADVPPDSMVASTHGIGLDNLMHYYNYNVEQDENLLLDKFVAHTGLLGKITPYVAQGSIRLLNCFSRSDGYHQGITVTCPGFYGPQGRKLRMPPAFPHLLDALATFRANELKIMNFEMETSAIYALGKALGHKCLSLNTVIANRATKTFSKDHKKAVDNMIKKTLEIIDKEDAFK